jgi:hypothetical protein
MNDIDNIKVLTCNPMMINMKKRKAGSRQAAGREEERRVHESEPL